MDEDKPKLEWMYKGATDLLNREEYLLGRTIDKNFEQLSTQEKAEHQEKLFGVSVPKNHVEYECIPFSIREYRNLQNTEQVDLQRKIMEDPLMAIKQKEMETRRKILENPVKLKELHKILKEEKNTLSSSSRNKSKKSKKSRKSKNKKRKSSSSSEDRSDSDKDLDKLLAKKYKKIKGSLDDDIGRDLNLDKLLAQKYKTLSKELDKATNSKHKKSKRKHKSSSDSDDSDSSNKEHRKQYKNNFYDKKSNNYRFDERRDLPNQRYETERSSRRSPDQYRRFNETKNSEQPNRTYRSESYKSQKPSSTQQHQKTKSSLTVEEKEQRRREMMEHAVIHDKERSNKVNQYRKEYESEEKAQTQRKFDDNFANKEIKKALSAQKSVESRIKSNLNNIQRSSRAMDTNFARK